MAFGDALGAKTEFLSIDQILRRYPPDGPREIEGDPALVTDDTQMALAVGEALLGAEQPYTASTLEKPLRDAFVDWSNSPDNDRAPGMTCLTACGRLAMGMPWLQATVADSKGCGANMRVQPVGLLKNVSEEERSAIAQFQAALTHGHATGLAAADLTAKAIAMIVDGVQADELPGALKDYAMAQRKVYHEDWLGDLWQRPMVDSPEMYITRGWDDCLIRLYRVDTALEFSDPSADPCLVTGGGWIAEEAFATGLLCFLLFPDDPVAAIRHAAVSSGDSDSIACITGAFAGARWGLDAWPDDWIRRIEYSDRLTRLGDAWD
jgi:ADP-ribosylglycohydrolase